MLLLTAPSPPIISDQSPSRLPSNIPLRTLPPRQYPDPTSRSTSLLGISGDTAPQAARRSPQPRPSSESGDIAEQLADDEYFLQFQRADDPHDSLLSGVRKSQKRVRVESPPGYEEASYDRRVIDKEAIEIPVARPRQVPRAERALAAIMGSNPIHGLTGRPLMYVRPRVRAPPRGPDAPPRMIVLLNALTPNPHRYFTSIFVSLGVFLFGYDQGVMSGIIT